MKKLLLLTLLTFFLSSFKPKPKGMYLEIKLYKMNGKVKIKKAYGYSPLCINRHHSLIDGGKRVLFERVDSFKVLRKSYKRL